jgi:DNA polymerase-3 subunit delta
MARASGSADTRLPPVHLVRGDDPGLVRDAVHRLVDELVGDDDRSLAVEELAGDDYSIGTLVDAAQTPPFLTERRVVVARDAHRFSSADAVLPLVRYLDDPLATTALVVVWESGRVPKSLLDAVKAAGGAHVDTGPAYGAKGQRQWVQERIAEAQLRLDAEAVELLLSQVGEDLNRVGGVLATLAATFGPGSRLGPDDIAPYLGEAGAHAPWELTDAIDRGDITTALDRLHRMTGAGGRHSLQVLFTLHGHYARMLALDGADVGGEKDAAARLGLRGSTFPARKALEQVRRLGSARLAQAFQWLAQADVDLRGAKGWPDELVLEVLVARLANLSRAAR